MSGRRNKPARARLLSQMKKDLSLTSVPKSEDEAELAAASPIHRLDNHFLWTVVQRSQMGEGAFPHLYEYYEKPNLHGRDFDKITYVLYMDKGTVVDRNTTLKDTQTVVSGVFVPEEPSSVMDPYYGEPSVPTDVMPRQYYEHPSEIKRVPSPERRKKKRLISEFYYIKKDRSRSRSPGDINKYNSYLDYGWQKQPEGTKSHVSFPEDEVAKLEDSFIKEKDQAIDSVWNEVENEKENLTKSVTKAVEKKRGKQDRWQLRAGADTAGRGDRTLNKCNEDTSPVVKKNSSKVMAFVKCGLVTHAVTEDLLKTPSGTNQYLYVPGKKRLK